MADRRDYYLEQTLTEGELDAGFDGTEQALWNMSQDIGFNGVISGLSIAESTPIAMTIDATLGTAYDEAGRRVRVPANQEDFDCSADEDSVPTEVVGVGNERWLALFAEFDRVLSDPRIDGASQTVYFVRDEGFKLVIRQGAEDTSGAAIKVALDPNLVLLADILLIKGQVSITNADIYSARRQNFVIFNDGQIDLDDAAYAAEPLITGTGTVQSALLELAAAITANSAADAAHISTLTETDATPGSDEIGVRDMSSFGHESFAPVAGTLTDFLTEVARTFRDTLGVVSVKGATYFNAAQADATTWFLDLGAVRPDFVVAEITTNPSGGTKFNVVTSPIYFDEIASTYKVAIRNDSAMAQDIFVQTYFPWT